MTEWLFELNDTEIDEPQGFNDIVFNVTRDELWHGVFFEASTSQLSFYGEAYDIIKDAKEQYGVDAVVVFRASSRCEGQTDYETVIEGRLNFRQYQELCGRDCLIRISVEQDDCALTFKNRLDQKVNIDSNIAFDKLTVLPDYTGLGFNLSLPTQVIPIATDGEVSEDGDGGVLTDTVMDTQINSQALFIRPIYARVNDNSIMTGSLDDPISIFEDPDGFFVLTPQLLVEELQDCIINEFDYSIRMKGTIRLDFEESTPGGVIGIRLIVDKWDGTGLHRPQPKLHAFIIDTSATNGFTYNFDQTFTGNTTIPEGTGLYAYIEIVAQPVNIFSVDTTYHFDPETNFVVENQKECPPTDTEAYLINETLARATESITDGCLTIESEYYGRVDSQPFAQEQDGCGGLRIVTPGLKIRQAEDKQFFASMKELLLGLRGIDNIGMGMEPDRVRIEEVRWFYKDVKILDLLLIPTAQTTIEEELIYSNIRYGYNKWEIKSLKGIDEFNSYKERRTGIKSVQNELDITSDLITAGYITETLRVSTLVNSGQQDNEYDNNIFLICVRRAGYDYQVEQGIAESAANFFSPPTAYNWRVRPLYNIMRWFKSIAQSYVNIVNTGSQIFFTSGTGNYLAEGMISPYDTCSLDGRVLAENDDLHADDFKNIQDATPIYRPETITFTYPLSIADYKAIKASPYGYINVQCGTGPIIKTYIKTIEYKPAEGTAEFVLLKAWQ